MIDILSLNHFVFFVAVGVFIKNKYQLVLIVGILWEIFETMITSIPFTRNLVIKYWFVPQKYWDEHLDNKIMDIIINLFGYHIGNIYL
tara:strand:- start:21 stop:284 length:264 start_codon:yes stop_codon:yes gene_type:complete